MFEVDAQSTEGRKRRADRHRADLGCGPGLKRMGERMVEGVRRWLSRRYIDTHKPGMRFYERRPDVWIRDAVGFDTVDPVEQHELGAPGVRLEPRKVIAVGDGENLEIW